MTVNIKRISSLWFFMVIIAVVAIAISIGVFKTRRNLFIERTDMYAEREAWYNRQASLQKNGIEFCLRHASMYTKLKGKYPDAEDIVIQSEKAAARFQQEYDRYVKRIAHSKSMKEKYLYYSSRPWLQVPPDEDEPE